MSPAQKKEHLRRMVGKTPSVPRARILGVDVSNISVAELHRHIRTTIHQCDKSLVLNVNTHALNIAYQSAPLRQYFNSADVVFTDGFGVILASRILGKPTTERITYAEWMWDLASFCEAEGHSLYFLGARSGVALEASSKLTEIYPQLKVVGTHSGYFEKSTDSAENEEVLADVNNVRPNILVVGFGMPSQEMWLMENWERIDANIALTGGAVFDYLSGRLRRPPGLLTNYGFEWLGRLIIEPRRLWKRYLLGNPLFLWRVLRQRFGASNT